ncbi:MULTISPECIES: hypothetical protein [unclassified Streptomyces]|uniref:hypothetical protein n=1 Tax=unclassified Streptomyces TaxID=2593676 RepID=UPI0020247C35|nr:MULTISPECIES: hypothetical protein [unclassified Streptomyces]MCX4550565.1 hypothetical protein [Streptomyces sp. NBC_01500]WSC22012.1 hypothetical protein OIE60_21290 [Streptomyces sp. NBC_01766]
MNQHAKAATRARLLADLIRGRADQHPEGGELRSIVQNLRRAAGAFRAAGPTSGVPNLAAACLTRARMTAARTDTGIAITVFDYVTAPVTGWTPYLPDLLPADPKHVRQENELHARNFELSGHLDSREEDVLTAALVALVDLHGEYERLAAEVALHGRADTPPTTFRPHTGSRTAAHLPGHLTVFDGGLILAELEVPYDITPGEIWQLIRTAEPAHRALAA